MFVPENAAGVLVDIGYVLLDAHRVVLATVKHIELLHAVHRMHGS